MSKAQIWCNGVVIALKADNITGAMREADEWITYTRSDVYVRCGDEYRVRKWRDTRDGIEDCENPISFGEFGYYEDWREFPDGRDRAELEAYYADQKSDVSDASDTSDGKQSKED